MAALFGGWGSDPFAEQVEKATSELLPAGQEDIALNLEICDQVRAKQVPAKQAMQVIKRRLGHKNPNVVLLALGLTDICIKNGGDHFLAEVASREFMDNLVSILRNPAGVNVDVKAKALGLIQNWSQIAETKPQQMGYISETYKSLSTSGFEFPPKDPKSIVSAALVETMTAPEWTDSDVCMRCRTAFTTFNRKHHCRNCGNVFCQDCSGKTMALPWFGVGQDVRVCDGCYAKKAPPNKAAKLSRSTSAHVAVPTGRGGAGSHHRSRTMDSVQKRGSSRSTKEDDDLALAIKLSLEASSSSGSRPGFVASQPPVVKEGRATKQADGRMLEGTDSDDDPDLAAAIAASLRDYSAPAPSAPEGLDDARTATPRAGDYRSQAESRLPLPPSLELPASDVDALLSFAHETSIQEAYARQHGQWQPAHQQYHTQELYEKATAARPRVARSLDEATRRHGVLVSMHDKLSEAVRLYDRLLDAQLSRPVGYSAPYYSAPQQQAQAQAYAVGPAQSSAYQPQQQAMYGEPHGVYPSMPMQGQGGYPDSDYQHQQDLRSPGVQYGAVESPYMGQQSGQYFSARPSYSSGNDYASQQTHYGQPNSQQQQPLQRHGVPSEPSAPPAPSASSVTSQTTGSSAVYNNHWQTLESLPSAPTNTTTQAHSGWTHMSPPSQTPAQGSLYGNIPALPQFEALPAHQKQQHPAMSDLSATGPTSPSNSYMHHASSGTRPQAGLSRADEGHGWSNVPIQKTGAMAAAGGGTDDDTDNHHNTINNNASSPYSHQPWTRPLETPLIDL